MSSTSTHIITIGGGGLSQEPDKLAIERYIMKQARRPRPSVCFIPTASGEDDAYIVRFYSAFSQLDARATHLHFFRRTPDLRSLLLQQDIIYVGGGNTKSMLAVWREWGLPDILREAWQSGTVLCGSSAGAICWFETGITDSWADALHGMPCLGFVPGVGCPHYDGEKDRRPAVQRMVQAGEVADVLALDDGAAAHFQGTERVRIVTSRPQARGYRVSKAGDGVKEEVLPFEYVGPEPH
jgi:dipeptidase E